jgi:hypothetical protein
MSETLMRKHNHYPYANPNAGNLDLLANDFFQFYQSPRRNQTFNRDVDTTVWPSEANLLGQIIIYLRKAPDPVEAYQIVCEAVDNLFDFFANKDAFVKRLNKEVLSLGLVSP